MLYCDLGAFEGYAHKAWLRYDRISYFDGRPRNGLSGRFLLQHCYQAALDATHTRSLPFGVPRPRSTRWMHALSCAATIYPTRKCGRFFVPTIFCVNFRPSPCWRPAN